MEHAEKGVPGQLLGENFAGRVGVNEGLDARARRGSVVAEANLKTFRRFFDGGSGKAGDLEETLRHSGISSGIESRGRFRLVGSDRGVGIEAGAEANFDFYIVNGAFGFDNTMPAEGRTGFRKGGHSPGLFPAVGARFQRGDSGRVHREANCKIDN